MAELTDWNTTAANNNSAPPNGWPENMNYAQVNNAGREMMAVLARWHKDNNGSLLTGGSSNAYTLSPNRSVSAYSAGLEFEFEASFSNTGAATLNVSTLGAVSVKRADGNDLAADEIQAGGIYKVIHDGTNFQLVGAMASSSGRLSLSSTTVLSLAESAPVLMLGASSAANLAFDTNSIQGRNNGAAAAIGLNEFGGNVNVGAQSGTGHLNAYADGSLVFSATASALNCRDGSGSVPTLNLQDDAGVTLGQLRYNSGLQLRSVVHGGTVALLGEDNSGVERFVFNADPDAGAAVYYAGLLSIRTLNTGLQIHSTADDTPIVGLYQDDNTTRNALITAGTTALTITNEVHGTPITLRSEDSGGTNRVLFTANPDGSAGMYHSGIAAVLTSSTGGAVRHPSADDPSLDLQDSSSTVLGKVLHAGGSGLTLRSLEHGTPVFLQGEDSSGVLRDMVTADPDGAVTLEYDASDSLRTSNRAAADIGSGAQVTDGGNNWRPVGYNVTPISSVGVNSDLRLATVGYQIRCTAAITIDVDATTNDAPDGAVWIITNESGGSVSLTGTGVTLTWLDGAGGSTGTRALADGGVATVTKRADGQYQVWGAGLS